MDKQREMFEAWQIESGRTDPMWLGYNDEEKSYALNDVQAEWNAWQAAIAAQWQPIETAPKVELKDLIVFNGEVQHGQWWEGCWINSFQECMVPQPTMWHELPLEPTK